MRGDPHAGFCESRGVRLPPATHLNTGFHINVQQCDGCEAVYEELTTNDGVFDGVRRVG